MSFARFSYSDVYVYEHVGGFIECCACSLKESTVDWYAQFKTPREAIAHLKEHKKAGHDIGGAIKKIKNEYADLDTSIEPYVRSEEEKEQIRKLMRESRKLQPSEPDLVNHPPHYTSDPSGVEAITVLRHRNYNIGNAMKYLWRAGLKNQETHVQDLQKAIFYINDEINRLNNK